MGGGCSIDDNCEDSCQCMRRAWLSNIVFMERKEALDD